MDKMKLLNIALLAFLLTMVIQLVFPAKKNTTNVTPGVSLSIQSDSITIPNIPKITLHNTSSGALTINPCEELSLSVDSVPLIGFRESTPVLCTPLVVAPGTATGLSLNPLYQVFASKPGKYMATLKTPFGDRMVSFQVSEPGLIRSALSKVVYEPIYNLFVALITWLPGHSLGWAIVVITLIIRLILLVPQQHMLESQKKLQELQPKIKAIQKEYKGDQTQLGMKMMELYKKEGVNPMGSCLPLLIQMPILIGLYWVISGITDPSNFYHLYAPFKGFDPSKIVTDFFGVNLAQVGGTAAIIFAVVLGFVQWLQAYLSFSYTNKGKPVKTLTETLNSPEPTLDPAMMQKMMLYFIPVMVAGSAFFFPLGVGLYWLIGTLFVIAQQWYVNVHSEKKRAKGEIVKKS